MRNQLTYNGKTYTDRTMADGTVGRETDLTGASLAVDTLAVTVVSNDPSIIDYVPNAPMVYTYTTVKAPSTFRRGVYHLQSVSRVGPRHYTLYGMSPLGRLTKMTHPGGIYTGQIVEAVVKDICGDVPVIVKTSLAEQPLYGWLPYVKPPQSSARDNLAQVLYAIGAVLVTDYNGVLRVQPYWDGLSGAVLADEIYEDASVVYEQPVSEVRVTEHQYSPGQDEIDLFDGTSTEGQLLTFDEPVHSLQASGLTIRASGPNWARLSSGTGTVTGKRYTHTTREVVEEIDPGAASNVKTETACTLVSLINSRAVAQRLAAYYRCRETIEAPIKARWEMPGYVVSIYHPYDRKLVNACISDMDITMSSVLKAEMRALVGFTPPQHTQISSYDRRVVLTGSGTFQVPEGADHLRVVLGQAGAGGWSGLPGEAAAAQRIVTQSNTGLGYNKKVTTFFCKAGEGGEKGVGGSGGKILQAEMDVTAGQLIPYHCGVGGAGGAYSADGSVQGAPGGETTFGALSSAQGGASPGGFFDPVGNVTYGADGDPGVAGGKGSGASDGDQTSYPDPVSGGSIVYRGVTYHAGNATMTVRSEEVRIGTFEWLSAAWTEGCGGGAAAGANGNDGLANGTYSISRSGATARAGSPGNGAAAIAPPAETRYGYGGIGGNGGGGGGSPGISEIYHHWNSDYTPSSPTMTLQTVQTGQGGEGSDGGQGGPGWIIVYYTVRTELARGAVMSSNGRFILDKYGRLIVV